jgi:hypothetical protein
VHLHGGHRIGIERGEDTTQMAGIEQRRTIQRDQVLVGSTRRSEGM